MKGMSTRLKVELGLATASFVLMLVTLVWRDWIETVFRVDPDHGNGSFEWIVVAALAVATLVFALLARVEWRRLREAARGPSPISANSA